VGGWVQVSLHALMNVVYRGSATVVGGLDVWLRVTKIVTDVNDQCLPAFSAWPDCKSAYDHMNE